MKKWFIISLSLHIAALAVLGAMLLVRAEPDYIAISPHLPGRPVVASAALAPDENAQPVLRNPNRTNELKPPETNIVFSADAYAPAGVAQNPPIPIDPVVPVYPEQAKRIGIEGTVVVTIYINDRGIVDRVDIVRSPSDMLSESARTALMRTRFVPAQINGARKAVKLRYSMKFVLE